MQFFYVSHFLQIWLLPPGINLVLAAIGFLLLRHSKLLGKSVITLSLVSLWIFSTPIIAQFLIDTLQYQYPLLQVDSIPKNAPNSAIIVLGGGDEMSPEYANKNIPSDATQARLHYAAYLYQKLHIPIIVSGGHLDDSLPTEADLMQQEMKSYFNIPVQLKEDKSINTRDEGNFMVPILQKNGIKVAYLITNAWHIPRSMYTFNSSFKNTKIKIIAAPMGYTVKQRDDAGFLSYLPTIGALRTSTLVIHEYIGILTYQFRNLLT